MEKSSNKFLNVIIILFLLFVGIFVYARYMEPSSLTVNEYKVKSNVLPSNFSGVKVIHFSDLHYGSTFGKKELSKLVTRINIYKPDLVLFTGDLIDKHIKVKDEEINLLTKELNKIESNLGKYAVRGDEDVEEENFNKIMNDSGFKILDNSYELVYNDGLFPIFIGGTASSLKGTIDYDKTFVYYKKNKPTTYNPKFKIIMTHEGDNTKEILEYDNTVDMILGGHSLNGTIRIPFYGGIFSPNGSKHYSTPKIKEGNTNIFISNGLGTKEYKYRLLNKPSFNIYRLKSN